MPWNRKSKYHAVKINTPDGVFDSKKEYRRWLELLRMQEDGEIKDLQRQQVYELIPAYKEPDTVGPKGGIRKGKVIEKACTYIADFCYIQNGELVVEDTKGMKTPDYIIKRKLMLFRQGIRIKEV